MPPNTDHAHNNKYNWTITWISVKYSLLLPDDGSCVIRNMLEWFFRLYFLEYILNNTGFNIDCDLYNWVH
jgi:hypothetical protein